MYKLIKQAFTLIELLVVIAIIGILSGLIVISMSGVTQKATIAKAQVFSNSLRNALMMNLVSEWKMDEGTGQTTIDSWSGGNNGTLGSTISTDVNDPTWTTSGCISGNCLSFDGINDYVNYGSNSSLNSLGSITIGAWINTTSLTTQQAIWGNGNYRLVIGSGLGGGSNVKAVGFIETGVNLWVDSIDNVLTNGWMYVVFTKNGSGAINNIYLNGVKITSGNGAFSLAGSGNTFIGASSSGGQPFGGLIDEVRIYNAAMPTSQIKEQYYAGLNSLLANGGMTKEEYGERVSEMASR